MSILFKKIAIQQNYSITYFKSKTTCFNILLQKKILRIPYSRSYNTLPNKYYFKIIFFLYIYNYFLQIIYHFTQIITSNNYQILLSKQLYFKKNFKNNPFPFFL